MPCPSRALLQHGQRICVYMLQAQKVRAAEPEAMKAMCTEIGRTAQASASSSWTSSKPGTPSFQKH